MAERIQEIVNCQQIPFRQNAAYRLELRNPNEVIITPLITDLGDGRVVFVAGRTSDRNIPGIARWANEKDLPEREEKVEAVTEEAKAAPVTSDPGDRVLGEIDRRQVSHYPLNLGSAESNNVVDDSPYLEPVW